MYRSSTRERSPHPFHGDPKSARIQPNPKTKEMQLVLGGRPARKTETARFVGESENGGRNGEREFVCYGAPRHQRIPQFLKALVGLLSSFDPYHSMGLHANGPVGFFIQTFLLATIEPEWLESLLTQ